jgi:DNA-binding HxlR family transcriptional regulator
MTELTKITFVARRVGDVDDLTDLVAILFPGNQNQQHAAARILLMLKAADAPVSSFGDLERQHGISRRTLQRTRAKLARLGLIEYASALSSRYGGQQGWRLSSWMGTALRQLADKIDQWRKDTRPERMEKDEMLVGLLR